MISKNRGCSATNCPAIAGWRYYGATPSADAVALKAKIEEKLAAAAPAPAPGFRKMQIAEESDQPP